MSLVTTYFYGMLGILQVFLPVACFAVFICIVTWYFICGDSLLQRDFHAAVHAVASPGNIQHVAWYSSRNRHEWPKSIALTLLSGLISQYYLWSITEVGGCALPRSGHGQSPKYLAFVCLQHIVLLSRGLVWAKGTDYTRFRVTSEDTRGKRGCGQFPQ